MGTCVSRPSNERAGAPVTGGAGTGTSGATTFRRPMVSSLENGKRSSTADVISAAFLAQANTAPEPIWRLRTKPTEDRRASAQASGLGIGPAPAAESCADLEAFPANTMKDASAPRNPPCVPAALPEPPSAEDSFELSRAETVKRLAALQKSFKASAGAPSPAWVVVASAATRDWPSDTRSGEGEVPRGRSPSSSSSAELRRGGGGSGSGRGGVVPGVGGSGSRRDRAGEEGTQEGEEAVVEAVGEDDGAGPEAEAECGRYSTDMAKAFGAETLAAAAAAAVGCDRILGIDNYVLPAPREGSRKDEACGTPRRDDVVAGACFRTISISRITGTDADATVTGGAATTTDFSPETDELTSLPLPNLVNPPGDAGRGGGEAGGGLRSFRSQLQSQSRSQSQPRAGGYRHSSAAVYTSQPAGPGVEARGSGGASGGAAAATRNSDLGYYLEEARLVAAAPLLGARPVRHNLMDSPLVRQRAEQAAREGDAAARPPPVVLDYVPAVKLQTSRGNLLAAQPSQKRLLPGGGGGGSLGGAFPPGDDDGDDGGAASRRLEYIPKKGLSRKFSHANVHSGPLLLASETGTSSASRPRSPVNGRPSLLFSSHANAGFFSSSPRVTANGGGAGSGSAGGADGEQGFHVNRAPAAAATEAAAAAAALKRPVNSASGSLPVGTAASLAAPRRHDTPTAAAPEPRLSFSASQVTFAAASVLQSPTQPSAALRKLPSQEHSRRSQRSVLPITSSVTASGALESRASGLPPSRLRMRSGSGAATTAASGGGSVSRRSALLHEVLGSAIWTGTGALAAAKPPTLQATQFAGGGLHHGGVNSSNAVQAGSGGGEAAAAAASSYSPGSGNRAAGRAARLLVSLQRLGLSEVAAAR